MPILSSDILEAALVAPKPGFLVVYYVFYEKPARYVVQIFKADGTPG